MPEDAFRLAGLDKEATPGEAGSGVSWQNFRRIAKRLKFPAIRPYDFGRHAYAAWLYEQNVHPKIIIQLLGHSSAAFTMDTYGYLDRGLQAPIAAKLQTWLEENAPKLKAHLTNEARAGRSWPALVFHAGGQTRAIIRDVDTKRAGRI